MKAIFLILCILAVASTSVASARPKSKAPQVELIPPDVALTMTVQSPARRWTMRVSNSGTKPLRIVADARLLSFDVTPRGSSFTTRCVLPDEMRESQDNRDLILVAGRSYSESVDPRLYCFNEKAWAALESGAVVVARLGYGKGQPANVFVAESSEEFPAHVATREMESVPFDVPPATVSSSPTSSVAAEPAPLAVSMPARIDVDRAFDRVATASVASVTSRPLRILLGTSTLGLTVRTPNDSEVQCGGGIGIVAVVERLTFLAPNAVKNIAFDLGSMCPDVFEGPGIYEVRPRMDTRHVSGASSFQGEVLGKPSLLRVRRGRGDPRPPPRVDSWIEKSKD